MLRSAVVLLLCFAACGPDDAHGLGSAALSPSAIPCEDTPVTYLGGDVGLSNRAQGLWTNPNVQTDAPDGALHKAENVELDRSGFARPRAGQERLATAYPDSTQRFRAGIEYQGYLFEFASATPGGAGTLYRRDLGTGALTSVLSMSPPTGVMRPRFADAGGDLYVTTSLGLRVADGPLASFYPVGFERVGDIVVDIITPVPGPGVVTFLNDGKTVAYRAAFVRTDSEGRESISTPSNRRVVVNDLGSPAYTRTLVDVPASARVGDRVRLYRTLVSDAEDASGNAIDPGDTLYLVADAPLDSSNISVGNVQVEDKTPDFLVGEPLYTNPTLEGVLGGNEAPPLPSDMLVFGEGTNAGRILVSNVTGLSTATFRLIGVPPAALTLSVDGVNTTIPNFSGGPSDATNIQTWARDFVTKINQNIALPNIRAFYMSGENDPPGIIRLERATPTDGPFTLVLSTTPATYGVYFEPSLETPLDAPVKSQPNAVYVSKRGQAYAYPLYSENRLHIGRPDKAILRMAALRNDVYVFKDGEGVFKLTPIGDGWNVEQMNQEVNLLIPESLAVLDNRILAYTNRGVVSVDAYGVDEVDVPVKDYTEALATLPAATVQAQTFAVSDPQRLCYWLWFPESAGATSATRALLWNGRANPPAWTERTDAATGGYESPGGRLYLGEPDRANITRSRNTGTVDDFQGPDANAYTVALKWPNRAEGIPGESKQFRQVRLFFERAVGTRDTPLPVAWTFTNDYATESPVRTNQVYGLPYSTMEPDPGWQRTSDMGTEVSFPVLRQYVVVKGIEEVVSGTAPVRGR